jgi:OmpA-OmpF porin, OOP family
MKSAKRLGLMAALWILGVPLNVALAQAEPGIYASLFFGNSQGQGSPGDFDPVALAVYSAVNSAADVRSRPSLDDKDSGYGFAVGYRFNRWLAVEGGYVDLGDRSYRETASGRRFGFDQAGAPTTFPANFTTRVKSNVAGFLISALGVVPLSYRWEAYGRAGIMIGNDEVDLAITDDTNGGRATFDVSESATDVLLGVGVSFSLAEVYSLRAEFMRVLEAGDELSGESDIDLLSLGVTVRF